MVPPRSGVLVVCLVVVLAGVPVQADTDGTSAPGSAQSSVSPVIGDALGCYPGVALSDLSMNVTRQTGTDLRTQGTRAASADAGGGDTFRLAADRIDAERICLRNVSATGGGTIEVVLKGVDLRGVSIHGPANIAFDRGTATSMTVWMPASSALDLAAQIPGALGNESSGEGPVNGTVDDTTDAVDDTVNDTADAVDDTLDNTTDVVNDTVDNTTDGVEDTVDNTTDAVDDTVDDTTGAVEDAVDTTTDTVDNTTDAVDNNTDAIDNTADTVNENVDDTTDAVNETTDTVEDATDAVNETTDTIDDTTDAMNGTPDTDDDTADPILDTATLFLP